MFALKAVCFQVIAQHKCLDKKSVLMSQHFRELSFTRLHLARNWQREILTLTVVSLLRNTACGGSSFFKLSLQTHLAVENEIHLHTNKEAHACRYLKETDNQVNFNHKRLTVERGRDACGWACVCVCVSDQEGGRWRSVSPEGALKVGLRSEGEGERMVEMGVSFTAYARGVKELMKLKTHPSKRAEGGDRVKTGEKMFNVESKMYCWMTNGYF